MSYETFSWDHSPHFKEGSHAFLSPSQASWLNYSNDQLRTAWFNNQAKVRGTKLHKMAAELIEENMRMPRNKLTFNNYVNDAIGFGMRPEMQLYYSQHCFGTADAIMFDPKRGTLRIHDLKTGITPAHMRQLNVYASLFFMQYGARYGFTPRDIETELRIYQNDDILISNPDSSELFDIMDRIEESNSVIRGLQEAQL